MYDATAIVLAGGKSRRMGRNKALLEYSGKMLIEIVLGAARRACREVMIIADDGQPFSRLGVAVYPDIYEGCGPLGGIHSGLSRSHTEFNLLLSCDLPLINSEVLMALLEQAAGYDLVLPRTADGRYHPLCAVYARRCLPAIEQRLLRRALKLADFYLSPEVRVKVVTEAELPAISRSLVNINTPEEYSRLLAENGPR